jgi:hypothetical protein
VSIHERRRKYRTVTWAGMGVSSSTGSFESVLVIVSRNKQFRRSGALG